MDGRSAFILDAAVRLIAAGGAHGKQTIEEAVCDLMAELHCLDDHFDPPPCDCGPGSGSGGGNPGRTFH